MRIRIWPERRNMSSKRRRAPALGLVRGALLLGGIATAVLVGAGSAASAAPQKFGFQGSAYGTHIHVGNKVISGRSALVVLGCTSRVGVTNKNTAASVKAPKILRTGTIDTSAASKAIKVGVASSSSATTQNVNLLDGMVTASTIKSVSTTKHNSSTGHFRVSPAGTAFVHLVVNGHAMGGTPPANTKVTLPGVGYMILNQHTSNVGTTSARMTVIGIHLVVTKPNPNAPIGTQAFVSVAKSSLAGPVAGLLHGVAYGTSAKTGNTVIAGRSFPQYLNCMGTNGVVKTNAGSAVNVPGVLKSGTITDTAKGTVSSTQVSGEMTSTVRSLRLLAGIVSARVVRADVTAKGRTPALGDASSFIGLKVSGNPQIKDKVPPNTKLSLPGIGTLWLHKRTKTSNGITVIMVQLIITHSSNPAGLPVGTTVDVGYAHVAIS